MAEQEWKQRIGLTVVEHAMIPDGTQVWMRGDEVLDITTNDRAKFYAMFGLMRVPNAQATKVMISPADFEAMKAAAAPNGE